MNKFKVGDKVKIVKEGYNRWGWDDSMDGMIGEVYKIDKMDDSDGWYLVGGHSFPAEQLRLVSDFFIKSSKVKRY